MPQIELIDPGFHPGESANVGGDLELSSTTLVDLPERLAAGEVVVELVEKIEDATAEAEEEDGGFVSWFVGALKDYLALLIVGAILIWLVPRMLGMAAEVIDARVLPSAGWGCLTVFVAVVGLIALFIATLLAFIIVGVVRIGPLTGPVFSTSVVLGTLLTFGLYLLMWVAKVVAAEWIGRWILARLPGLGAQSGMAGRFMPLLVGLVVLVVLMNIPGVGFLFNWIAVFMGLGAIVLASRPSWPRRGQPELAPPPAAA
jgi:hypothetical protein